MRAQADLRRYLSMLIRWSWLFIATALVVGGLSFFLGSRQTPVYLASTTILIDEAQTSSTMSEYNSILTSERKARTYAELLTAPPLLEEVIKRMGLSSSARILGASINVQPVQDTQLIRVDVRDIDPQRVAVLANTLVEVFAEQRQNIQLEAYSESKASLEEQMATLDSQIAETESRLNEIRASGSSDASNVEGDRLETALAQYRQTYGGLLQNFEQIRIAEAQAKATIRQEVPAIAPGIQVGPRVLRNTILAVMFALMVVMGMVYLREALDDTVKDPKELSEQLGLPILGQITRTRPSPTGKPVVIAEPRAPVSEAYRTLRTNIEFTKVDRSLRTLVVTSPSPGDGKSTTAVNLGAVLGQNDLDVVLIDADLRRPGLSRTMSMTNRTGLAELFVKPDMDLSHVMRQTDMPNVSVITAGSLPPNPAELLGSKRMQDIIETIQQHSDILIIDTPPLMAVTDAAILSTRVDGVLLVVRAGQTKLAACTLAVSQLRRVGAHILGLVINDIPYGRAGYHYGSYYSYYHYSDKPQTRLGALKQKIVGAAKTRFSRSPATNHPSGSGQKITE